MKNRKPSFGYGRISMQIIEALGISISRLAVHVGDVDGVAYCRMFNQITAGNPMPKYLSAGNDPLFLFRRSKSYCNGLYQLPSGHDLRNGTEQVHNRSPPKTAGVSQYVSRIYC